MQRKDAFHADTPTGNLADGEGAADVGAAQLDDRPAEHLYPLLVPFNHPVMNLNLVAGVKGGKV